MILCMPMLQKQSKASSNWLRLHEAIFFEAGCLRMPCPRVLLGSNCWALDENFHQTASITRPGKKSCLRYTALHVDSWYQGLGCRFPASFTLLPASCKLLALKKQLAHPLLAPRGHETMAYAHTLIYDYGDSSQCTLLGLTYKDWPIASTVDKIMLQGYKIIAERIARM